MPSFRLEVNQNGSVQNYSFNSASLTLGRDRSADFVLDHPTVSRQHCQIVYDPMGGGFKLVVLSRGGLTAIDGAQVSGEVPLYDGSMVNMGQMSVVFRSNEAAPKPMGGGGGFGMQSGFGAGAAGGGGGFGMQSGFGAGGAGGGGGGFGMQTDFSAEPPAGAGGAPKPKPTNVWDEIAQSVDEAEAEEEESIAEDDYYKRMEAAQQRGQKKAEGVNPLLIIATIIAAGVMVYVVFFSSGGGGQGKAVNTSVDEDAPPVVLDVSCLGKDDCVAQAKERFEVGEQILEKRDVHVTNLFEGYKKMLEVQELIAQGGGDMPPELAKSEEYIKETRAELDKIFRTEKVRYHRFKGRKMKDEMYSAVQTVRSYFPDKTTPEAKWAAEREREMKKLGLYPRNPR